MCQKGKMTIDKQSIHNWDAASHAYDLQNETLLTQKAFMLLCKLPTILIFLDYYNKTQKQNITRQKKLALILCRRQSQSIAQII